MEIIQPNNLPQSIFIVPRTIYEDYVYIRVQNEDSGVVTEAQVEPIVRGDFLEIVHSFDLSSEGMASYIVYRLQSAYINRVIEDGGVMEAHTCLTDEQLVIEEKEVMYRGKLYATLQSADLNYRVGKNDYKEEQSHNNDYLTF